MQAGLSMPSRSAAVLQTSSPQVNYGRARNDRSQSPPSFSLARSERRLVHARATARPYPEPFNRGPVSNTPGSSSHAPRSSVAFLDNLGGSEDEEDLDRRNLGVNPQAQSAQAQAQTGTPHVSNPFPPGLSINPEIENLLRDIMTYEVQANALQSAVESIERMGEGRPSDDNVVGRMLSAILNQPGMSDLWFNLLEEYCENVQVLHLELQQRLMERARELLGE